MNSVQEDTFTPLSPSLRLKERPKPVRPMLENTSKVQEAMDCLSDVKGRNGKLGKPHNPTVGLPLSRSAC